MLLHQYGTPSHRLERVMTRMAQALKVEGTFLYTPTALIVSVKDAEGERTYLRRVDSGALNVDKLICFDETLEQVEAGSLEISAASDRLEEIANRPSPFGIWLTNIACAVACAAVAIFFRGTPIEILIAGLLGFGVALVEMIAAKFKWETGLLEPVVGFAAAVGALAIAKFVVPIDDRLVTLAALIVIIPGLQITVALTELAVGHSSAGAARLASGLVSLLTITIGVALGWRLAEGWRTLPVGEAAEFPEPLLWLAILVAPLTFAIVFRARWPQWPVITFVAIAGFVTSAWVGLTVGLEASAFCGALVVGLGSNLYARLRDRPALVPFTPGIIVLVPGSLGYRSLTAFIDHETMAGVDFAFNMLIVAVALVGGILTSNMVLPPKRIL